MTNLFWIKSNNLGDAINPLLHRAITNGKEPIWSDPEKANTVIACGSLIHTARPGNILWGTGAMAEDMPPEYANKTTIARAVRGPMTAWMLRKQGVDISNTIFADPAILIPRYFSYVRSGVEERSLVIPHYTDMNKALKYKWGEDWDILSPMTEIETLLKSISHAATVITSSLHALIVAEAYDVPTVWVEFSDDVRGGGFKFWDYYLSTVRNPPEPVQIRNGVIPWSKIYTRVYEWTGPVTDTAELGDALLDACPFT